MNSINIWTVRQCWAALLLLFVAASSGPSQGLARSLSAGSWRPYKWCVKEIPNFSISPSTRGRTSETTYTYEKKFDDIDECFEECESHFIVYSKNSGRCYCWREQGCQAAGFCDDYGYCPGRPFGKWASESGMVVYDLSGCYGRPCDTYPGMSDDLSDSEEEDSSDSEEEDSSDSEEGHSQFREGCDYDNDSVSSNHCCSMPCFPSPRHRMPDHPPST